MQKIFGPSVKGVVEVLAIVSDDSDESSEGFVEIKSFECFEENAVNPLVSFMNQPIVLDIDEESQKEVPTEDSNNTAVNPFRKLHTTTLKQDLPDTSPSNILEDIIAGVHFPITDDRTEAEVEEDHFLRQLLKRKSHRERLRTKRLEKARQLRKKQMHARCPHFEAIVNSILTYFR